MNWRSIWAVLAGILVTVALSIAVDVMLHLIGVFPSIGEPITDRLALLATAYRVAIGIGGAWLTARLAPRNPMKHALVLGCIGVVLGLVGVVATWNRDLGPRWYPIALVVLAIPQSWIGAKLLRRQSSDFIQQH